MTEQSGGGPSKKRAAKKAPAKKSSAKKSRPPEKTASPRRTASQRTTANRTTAPRATKQATKKAAAPVEEADRAQAKDEEREPSGGLLDSAAGAAGAAVQLAGVPVAAARKVLDTKGGLPAYVSAGLLAVTGVVGWPVAAAGSAGYAAVRKWGQQLPEPLRTLTGSAPQQQTGDDTGGSERNRPA